MIELTRLEYRVLIACQELIKREIFPDGRWISQKLHAGITSAVHFGRIRAKLVNEGILIIPQKMQPKIRKEKEYDDKEIQERIAEIRETKVDPPPLYKVKIRIVKDPKI